MKLSSIAIRNIRRNFKDYFIYFASMIFSIVIYFTFKALQYNSQIAKASGESNNIGDAFKISSVMLVIFVAVFIIYSNGFFTCKRKKEVGLYSLLGIRKKQIGRMLFYENMLMGLLSLVIGIVIGGLLSKLFLELLISIMGLNLNVHFEVPIGAIIDTSIIFFVIVLYTSFQGYRLVYRFKLIELFHADRKGEEMPKGSIIMACISVFLIGSGYYLSLTFSEVIKGKDLFTVALYILLATVLGTYLLFMFFTVFILKRVRKNKVSFYYGMNIITTSQLLYRIRGNAKSLATIAVLSAVTLTSVGVSITTYYNTFVQASRFTPFSYSYEKKNGELDSKVNTILNEEKNSHPVIEQFEIEMASVKGKFEGEKSDNIRNANYLISEYYHLVSQSSFNNIAKRMNTDTVNLNDGEAFIYDSTYIEGYEFSPVYIGNKVVFHLGSERKTLTIKEAEGRSLTSLGELVVIVPDEVYESTKKIAGTRIVKNINVKNERNSKVLTEKLKKVMLVEEDASVQSFNDFYTDFEKGIEATGLIMFIGIFLGFVFLLATGSVIYFKQLAEANADRYCYIVLRKVGVTKKEMKKAIAKQMRFIFVIPLAIGILHSLFALKSLSTLIPYQILIPLLISMGVYGVIYIGYYFLTVQSYFKIVSGK
ncbi:FtsX-like permease family protein [Clostridium sp. Marseille-Q7071]